MNESNDIEPPADNDTPTEEGDLECRSLLALEKEVSELRAKKSEGHRKSNQASAEAWEIDAEWREAELTLIRARSPRLASLIDRLSEKKKEVKSLKDRIKMEMDKHGARDIWSILG